MDTEGERIKREIHAIEEVLAVKENMRETGDWQTMTQLQLETCVSPEFKFMEEMEEQSLEKRKKRLEQDLEDLQRRKDACDFNRKVELRRGKRVEQEEDGEM
jgi:protein subunit release factor A